MPITMTSAAMSARAWMRSGALAETVGIADGNSSLPKSGKGAGLHIEAAEHGGAAPGHLPDLLPGDFPKFPQGGRDHAKDLPPLPPWCYSGSKRQSRPTEMTTQT